MKKIFLMLLFLIASTQTTPAKGEEMDQFISKATMTLEEFNHYEDFLELPQTVQRIDIEQLKKNGGLMVYTLPNGITVRRDDWVGSYADDLTFPKSPFLYRSHYDTQGYLKQKVINFYGENFGFAINFDQHGNMIKKIDIDTFPQLKPHELREVMLDRNGIDIYVRGEEYEHKAKDVWLVLRSQVRVADTEVYEVYVFTKDNEREIEAYLINGETSEQIYVKKYQGPPSLSQTTLGMDYYKEIQPEKYDEYRRWNEDTMGGRIPPRSVELKLPDVN